jgi:hypothetical protein
MPKLSRTDRAAKVSATEANRRKEVALAELRELELKHKRGELLQAAAVRSVWAEQLTRIRDRFLAMPDRLSEAIANQPADVVREKLAEEIEDALSALAKNPL